MISFKCRTCGGEMSVSPTGDLLCTYCGSKQVFSDKELQTYRDFRSRMLTYLSAIANSAVPEETERIWQRAESAAFTAKDGRPVHIRYLFAGEQDGVTVYTARKSVLFLFPAGASGKASRFSGELLRLRYPSADIKGLSSYFPSVTGIFELDDGRTLLSVAKSEECFPLSALGSLPAEHVAWIVSRLENLCCVLAYSDIAHGGIDLESVFLNLRTHEAYLLGGWWNAKERGGGSAEDLTALRRVAKRIAGVRFADAPEGFRRFIESAPAKDAYADFSVWDGVIGDAFGGRVFQKLDLSNLNI